MTNLYSLLVAVSTCLSTNVTVVDADYEWVPGPCDCPQREIPGSPGLIWGCTLLHMKQGNPKGKDIVTTVSQLNTFAFDWSGKALTFTNIVPITNWTMQVRKVTTESWTTNLVVPLTVGFATNNILYWDTNWLVWAVTNGSDELSLTWTNYEPQLLRWGIELQTNDMPAWWRGLTTEEIERLSKRGTNGLSPNEHP